MTREKCLEVLDRYERFLSPLGPKKKDREMVNHILFKMIPKMDAMLVLPSQEDIEKFMRWLGFIQGVLWQRGWFTLEELKEHNRS
jgi:hypothetical protein